MGYVTITPHTSNLPWEGGIVQLTVESDLSGILETSSEQAAGDNHLPLGSLDIHTFDAGTTVVNFTIFSRDRIGLAGSPEYPLTHSVAAECPDATAAHGWVTDFANVVQATKAPAPAPTPTTKKGRRK